MTGGGLPPAVDALIAALGSNHTEPPDDERLASVLDVLRNGVRLAAARPIADQLAATPERHWLRLTEAESGRTREEQLSRIAAAWSAHAAYGGETALSFGVDAVRGVTAMVGLLRGAIPGWTSTQSPDLIWEPAHDPGFVSPRHEMVLHPWPTRPGTQNRAGAVSPLARMLAIGNDGWQVVLRVQPVDAAEISEARSRVSGVEREVARRLSTSSAVAHNLSVSAEDSGVRSMLDELDAWQAHFRTGAASGMWRVSAHVLAEDAAALSAAAAAVRAFWQQDVAGGDDGAVQMWGQQEVDPLSQWGDCFGWVTGTDLAAMLLPPEESSGSLQVRAALPSGRARPVDRRPIRLGNWLGTLGEASIDVDDLAGHAFITGITGSGKSTTTARLLSQLWNEHHVPFLVIDPAKTDYAALAPSLSGGLRVVSGEQLALNVLRPWPGRPRDRHIAHVANAFRGSFGMPVPVPYIAGLLFDEIAHQGSDRATLHDVASRLDSLVTELGYRGEVEDNIRASLGLRLRMLLQPERADRVASEGADLTWLTERPTLVQLGDLGDEDERAFLASMLVLYVADAARVRGIDDTVRHVTVVEEAHRLMPEPGRSSAETGDAGGVAARLMAQLLAEIRGYGESVLVVDQSPGAVAREVVRNTATKLAHRVVDIDDRAVLGGALGMEEREHGALGALAVGRCIVSTPRLLRPQVAVVQRMPVRDDLTEQSLIGAPAVADATCHRATDSTWHHVAEQVGARAELLVGLWAADEGRTDLLDLVRTMVDADPRLRASCVVSVGIRRHVDAVQRIGRVRTSDRVRFENDLRRAALAGEPAPAPPVVVTRGPFPGCVVCAVRCRARPFGSSGAVPRRAGLDAMLSRAPSTEHAAEAAEQFALDLTSELAGLVSRELALSAGLCVAVHAANRAGADRAFARKVQVEDEGGPDAR